MAEHSEAPNLTDALVELSFLIQATLARLAAEHDVSLTQVRLLGILRDREPGIVELAGVLNLDKSSVSGLVDRAAAPRAGAARLLEERRWTGDPRGTDGARAQHGRRVRRARRREARRARGGSPACPAPAARRTGRADRRLLGDGRRTAGAARARLARRLARGRRVACASCRRQTDRPSPASPIPSDGARCAATA